MQGNRFLTGFMRFVTGHATGMTGAEGAIVDKAVEKPFMGIFGTEKVNVLKLNAALEKAK